MTDCSRRLTSLTRWLTDVVAEGERLANNMAPSATFKPSTFIVNKPATFKLGQSVHKGRITKQHETELSTFFVEFESHRQENRWVDLELSGLVKDGEFSFWRLDGYDTWDDDHGSGGSSDSDDDSD